LFLNHDLLTGISHNVDNSVYRPIVSITRCLRTLFVWILSICLKPYCS